MLIIGAGSPAFFKFSEEFYKREVTILLRAQRKITECIATGNGYLLYTEDENIAAIAEQAGLKKFGTVIRPPKNKEFAAQFIGPRGIVQAVVKGKQK